MADEIDVNNSIQHLSFENMPIDEDDFLPVNNVQLAKSLYEYSKHIEQSDIENFYNDFKKLMSKYVITTGDALMKMSESKLRKYVRKLLFETPNDYADPLDVAADEDEELEKRYASQRSAQDKNTLDNIAKQVGAAGPSGVKRIEQQAIGKLRFMLKDLEPGELEQIKLTAADDYTNYLQKSAKKGNNPLSQEDVELLRKNPDIVMSLDGYREFLRKYILAAARKKGVKL